MTTDRPAARPTVADAMLTSPVVSPGSATVADVRRVLADRHRHAALVVDDGRLVGVLVEDDLVGADSAAPARDLGALTGRTVPPDADLAAVHAQMRATGRRRLAVVEDGRLLGLLCLKHHGGGFCTDATVAERRRG